jgi:hypothetical protein
MVGRSIDSEEISLQQIDWTEGARRIDECQYLFVEKIGESEELTLDILIVEAKAQAPITVAKNDSQVERLKVGACPIEPDPTCGFFRLIFEQRHMVAYMVSNESYSRYPEPSEEFSGKLFRIFSRSQLLEFTKRTSNVSDQHPGKLQHYQVVCENHIINVISTAPPSILVSSPQRDAARMLAQLGGSQADLEDIPRRRSSV